MALSLYRAYRPSTFSEVVGQDHITTTLQNAVRDGSPAHAYLFTGPRGTGKTTVARILAKSLLCEQGVGPDPDGVCEECRAIAEGTHPDVYELDAASRTGVDAVRDEIIGRVDYAPSRGGYKVYIIDEVHMLSTAAFNALLKTLEEPPAHVVFVLCTTHPHKVPDTIHSRCQRFDFRRISSEDIAGRLASIAASEGIEVDEDALGLMARHASGGMRNAITTLEQLAAFTGNRIALDDVEGLLGEVDDAALFEISGLVARRDVAGCFDWTARFVETGTDLAQFSKDFSAHIRDVYVASLLGPDTVVIEGDSSRAAALRARSTEFGGPERLARALIVLGDLSRELRDATDPRLRLEIALVRLCRPGGEGDYEALAERIEALEIALAAGGAVAALPRPAAPRVAPVTVSGPDPVPAPVSTPPVAPAADPTPDAPVESGDPIDDVKAAGTMDVAAARRGWTAALTRIRKAKPSRAALFETTTVDVDSEGYLSIVFPEANAFGKQFAESADGRKLISEALSSVFHRDVGFTIASGSVPAAACPVPVAPVAVSDPTPVTVSDDTPEPDPAPPVTVESEPAPGPTLAVEAPPAADAISDDPVAAAVLAAFGAPARIVEEATEEDGDEGLPPDQPEETNGTLI